MDSERVVLVTGGSGFLGSHVVQKLLEVEHARVVAERGSNCAKHRNPKDIRSAWRVEKMLSQAGEAPITELRVFDVRKFDVEFLELPFKAEDVGVRLKSIVGSVTSEEDVSAALEGVSEVYHLVSVIDSQTRHFVPKALEEVNVGGNRLLLRLSKAAGVNRFVYTSSFTVACGWEDINEHPTELSRFLGGAYGYTKYIAEKEVLAANSSTMHTIAMRPIAVYGERDVAGSIPDAIRRSRGSGCVRIGDGSSVYDHSYAPNVAWAHICAMTSLRRDPEACGGKFFWAKDDDEPCNQFEFVEPFVVSTGGKFPPKSNYIPHWIFVAIVYIIEAWVRLVSVFGFHIKTPLSPFMIWFLALDISYNDADTRSTLQYEPLYSPAEARERVKQDVLAKLASNNFQKT